MKYAHTQPPWAQGPSSTLLPNSAQTMGYQADSDQSVPVKAFPANAGQSIMEWHQQTGFDLAMICAVALGAMALTTQGLYDVSPTRGRQSPVSLYMTVVAKSGAGKTPTFEKFLRPFQEHQKLMESEYIKSFQAFQALNDVWNTQKDALKSLIKKAIKANDDDSEFQQQLLEHHAKKPNEPKNMRLLISDITPASIHQCLESNPLSIGLVSAEAGSIIDGHVFDNFTIFNQMWSGETVQYNRHNRPAIWINARCSILMGIQYGGAWDFIKKFGVKAYQNGFIPRTNFIIIDDAPNPVQNRADFSEEHLIKFHAQITRLLEQCFPTPQQQSEVKERECLKFSGEAEKYWLELEKKTKAECSSGGFYEAREEYAAKWPDQVARIAAVLHVFDNLHGDISLEAVKRAEEIGDWLAYEFIEAFSETDPAQENAEKLKVWLEEEHRKSKKSCISLNSILQYGPYGVREKKARDAALQILEQEKIIKFDHGGKISYVILLITDGCHTTLLESI